MDKKDVLNNKVDDKELEKVSGGALNYRCQALLYSYIDEDTNNCVNAQYRWIYKPSFPNCAATVEDGSHCLENDACYGSNAIQYREMHDCSKAWR